ncbi:MAG: selenocysteine-specific translation elongation factor [Pseudomonadota bacterium]
MIVATAGHVDHGKTSLVRVLTGADTDKLPEEKKRGLSIDLGFAYLPLPDNPDKTIGFVDVPGHEKFVRNMIAGVGSLSLALLVVAADDGLMPQTLEHLAILKLLGVPHIVPVVTKSDLVDDARLQHVQYQISDCLQRYQYNVQNAFMVSIHQPESFDRLRDYLYQQLDSGSIAGAAGHFRLAIDRCFTVSGAGTVVTGTVLSGRVTTEDTVYLLGNNTPLRIRGLHTQGVVSQHAVAAQRCALNVAGNALRRRQPARGDYITDNINLGRTALLDVGITALDINAADTLQQGRTFKHWTPCHIHLATESVTCRVALLQSPTLADGHRGYARIYCDKPIGAVAGDRFVLRDQSARITIAGGYVIDPLPPRRGRSTTQRIDTLNAMDHTEPAAALVHMLSHSAHGVDLALFNRQFNCTGDEVAAYIDPASHFFAPGQWAVSHEHWRSLQQTLLDVMQRWHSEHPLLLGASIDQLAGAVKPRLIDSLAGALLAGLVADNKVSRKGATYRLQSWSARLDDEHENHWQQIQPAISNAGRIAPRVIELAELLAVPVDDVTRLLNTFVAHGRLFRVSANRYYLPAQLLELGVLAESLAKRDELTVATFRDESDVGRNLVVELLEFFDRCQFTRRIGQQRSVLCSAESVFS